jgi:hypothetical protein
MEDMHQTYRKAATFVSSLVFYLFHIIIILQSLRAASSDRFYIISLLTYLLMRTPEELTKYVHTTYSIHTEKQGTQRYHNKALDQRH